MPIAGFWNRSGRLPHETDAYRTLAENHVLNTFRFYRASFVLSLTLFAASLTAGIYQSIKTGRRLPPITMDYTEHIDKLTAQGEYDAAITQMRLLQKIETAASWQSYNNMGMIFFEQGKLDEAIINFQRALEINPRSTAAHHNIADVFSAKRDLDKAIEHYEQVLFVYPDDPLAHDKMGSIFYSQDKLEEAIDHYRRALRAWPGNAQLHYNVGNVLLAQGKLDEAIDQYQQALSRQPDNAEARINLASVLCRQGKYGPAIDHYRQALRVRPDLVEVYFNLGSLFCAQGRLSPAVEAYHHALQVRPEKAVVHFRRALEGQTDFAEAHYGHYAMGMALATADQVQLAFKHFKKSMSLKPRWPLPLNSIAWFQATHPDPAVRDGHNAIKFARRALRLTGNRNAQILDTLAAAYAESGLFEPAVATAQKAIAVAEGTNAEVLASKIRTRLELYSQQKPYRESNSSQKSTIP